VYPVDIGSGRVVYPVPGSFVGVGGRLRPMLGELLSEREIIRGTPVGADRRSFVASPGRLLGRSSPPGVFRRRDR
jgi:hypothetical protein